MGEPVSIGQERKINDLQREVADLQRQMTELRSETETLGDAIDQLARGGIELAKVCDGLRQGSHNAVEGLTTLIEAAKENHGNTKEMAIRIGRLEKWASKRFRSLSVLGD